MNSKPITPWRTQVLSHGLLGAILQLLFTIIIGIPTLLVWLMMMFGPFILFAWLIVMLCRK
jgi:hypothetical protein